MLPATRQRVTSPGQARPLSAASAPLPSSPWEATASGGFQAGTLHGDPTALQSGGTYVPEPILEGCRVGVDGVLVQDKEG